MTLRQRVSKSPLLRAAVNWLTNRTRKGENKLEGFYKPLMIASSVRMYGSGNKISFRSGMIKNCQIFIEGTGNEIIVHDNAMMIECSIWIKGNGCRIEIGEGYVGNNMEFGAQGDGSRILVRDDCMIGGYVWLRGKTNMTQLAAVYSDGGRLVELGKGGRISEGAVIRNSDSHNIFDEHGEIQNPPTDIVLGERCWVCLGAAILKGTRIGNDCVIGANSILTKDFSAANNAIIAGNPAKIIKENVTWRM